MLFPGVAQRGAARAGLPRRGAAGRVRGAHAARALARHHGVQGGPALPHVRTLYLYDDIVFLIAMNRP